MLEAPRLRPILSRKQVEQFHPVSDKTRRAHEAAGLFPKRVRIPGTHLTGYFEDEIARWQNGEPWQAANAEARADADH